MNGKTGHTVLSAAVGLGLFWVLESAVCRYVGLDLFLPVQAGRIVRLVLVLAMCLAIGLTGWGRHLRDGLDAACKKDLARWAVATAVAGLFFLWAVRVTVPAYMTNDDVFFMQAIANIPRQGISAVQNTLAHSAQETTSSISILLCAIIGFFYGLDMDGYWYLGYHLLIGFVCLTVIGRCVLVKFDRRRWPIWAGCALYGLFCGGMFLYAIAQIAFTVTSAVAGTASVALVLCRHHEERRSGRVLCDILSAALLILCCLQRRATGYCLGCFWALAAAYQLLRIRLDGKKALPFCLSCVLALVLVVGCFMAAGLESDQNYRDAEHYRSLVLDFLNDKVTYEQYERAGIPQELASLVQGWFFMDERVTTDMFRTVSDLYYADQEALPVPSVVSRVGETVTGLLGYVRDDPQMRYGTLGVLALLLSCAGTLIWSGKRYWPELLAALCAAGGGTLLLLYLVRDGRFLTRTFLVVAIPAAVTILLMALSAPEDVAPGRSIAAGTLGGIAAAVFALSCVWGVYAVPHATDTATRSDVFAEQWAIEDYARAHSDTTVYTSIYGIIFDPLHTPADYPANRIVWGACGDTAKDASDRVYAQAFFRDDVLFMTDRLSGLVGLLQYLSSEFGPVQAVVDAQLSPAVTVSDISLVQPGDDYTGWYEQNGMTYYFRDGRALTGTQVIDGETYTFAPAGVQAQVRPIPGENGLIYTTNAYSLIQG